MNVSLNSPKAIADAGERIYQEKFRAALEAAHLGEYAAIIDNCINNAIIDTEVQYSHAQTEGKCRAFGRPSPSRLGVVG